MTEKSCYYCFHHDVCENRNCWIDPNDSSKHTICHHFKTTADVVEVVRCKDCKYLTTTKIAGDSVWICKNAKGMVSPDPDLYCSYGERKEEK